MLSPDAITRSRRLIPCAAALIALTAGSAQAINKSWNVAGSGTWSTASAWTPAGVPAAADAIFIGNTAASANGSVRLTANTTAASLTASDGMTLNTNGFSFTLTGDLTATGYNTLNGNGYPSGLRVEQSPAAIDCQVRNITVSDNARADIHGGSTLRATGLIHLDGGHMYGDGVLSLTGNGARSLIVDGVLQPSTDGFTITQTGTGLIDLDGTVAGDRHLGIAGYMMNGTGFANLTIFGTALFDTFDDDLWIGGNSFLAMNLNEGWTIGPSAELVIYGNSQYPGPAQINGSALQFNGSIRFVSSNAHGQFNCPLTLGTSASAALTENDVLECNGTTIIQGGLYTLEHNAYINFDGPTTVQGGWFQTHSTTQTDGMVNFRGPTQWNGSLTVNGLASQSGNATVIGTTTINAAAFDLDGTPGSTNWTINAALTINAHMVDAAGFNNDFGGVMTIAGSLPARLTVNLLSPSQTYWRSSGTINVTGDANLYFTRLAGSPLWNYGNLNVTNRVLATCDLRLLSGSTTTFTSGTSILRLSGQSYIASGASFAGTGTLYVTTTGTMNAAHNANLAGVGLTNEGVFDPGNTPGTPAAVSVGRFTQTANGRLDIDIGGYAFGTQYDRITTGSGPATLAGDISVRLADLGNSFQPNPGDLFTIILSPSGVSGTFAANPQTISNGFVYQWTVLYGATNVRLRLDSITPIPCPADFNQDGGIDGADVDAFFEVWEQGISTADVNEDGGVDGADVDAFFDAWEAGGCV
ncbi:MAG: hypothetical protein JNK25_06290 [Phycisphaerae bacterium]|nr:hypothetical protein [Phycisphaerae bacterium]